MNEPRTFYVWKENILNPFSTKIDWRGLSLDFWFIYIKFEHTIIKTEYLELQDVEDYIRKTYNFLPRERPRPLIIAAAPQNLDSINELVDLDYEIPVKVSELNFDGLMKKDVLFIRSEQNKDLSNGENLYTDIAYKKIIDPEVKKSYKYYRIFLSALRISKLSEYERQFPDFKFESAIITYYTYKINPACNRTFEELYEDFESQQLMAGYDSYLDYRNGI